MKKTEINTAYQGDVTLRMMGNDMKKMEEFHEDYREYCRGGTTKYSPVPTKDDYKIAKDWMSIGRIATAKKWGIKETMVDGTVNRVSRYQMRQNA